MNLDNVRIENFRAFDCETIPFDDYTCLIGPNGCGKSTVLTALNVFFRENQQSPLNLLLLSEEDFHQRNTKDPIRITLTFTDLSAEAKNDFAAYFRDEKLVISAVAEWNSETGIAQVRQRGQRYVMKDFTRYFDAEKSGKLAGELKRIYQEIRTEYPGLPHETVKARMKEALQQYEADHPDRCELVQSNDEFYGFAGSKLPKYIQWVYVPAVKDASEEQLEARNTVLGKLLQRTVRSKVSFDEELAKIKDAGLEAYAKLLDTNQGHLDALSNALSTRIQDWAHPDARLRLKWHQEPNKSVSVLEPSARIIAGEGGFDGMLPRLGHGLQRSYLLAILHELAASEDASAPKLLLGCEEPELYQHPPQARHMAGVLRKLSEGNAQVTVCTHSPHFVSGHHFEDVRLIRKSSSTYAAKVSFVKMAELSSVIAKARGKEIISLSATGAKIEQALRPHLNEMFFTPVLVLVEGLEDAAYIQSWLTLADKWDEFRRLGCHIVPTDGKSAMLYPLALAKKLGIPTFVVFDGDADTVRPDERTKHELDNRTILELCSVKGQDPMPGKTLWTSSLVMWHTEIGKVIREEVGTDKYQSIHDAVRTEHDLFVKGMKKNIVFIGHVLAKAWEDGIRSSVLERLCQSILAFAEGVRESALDD